MIEKNSRQFYNNDVSNMFPAEAYRHSGVFLTDDKTLCSQTRPLVILHGLNCSLILLRIDNLLVKKIVRCLIQEQLCNRNCNTIFEEIGVCYID
jgi:hypothetical protein